MDAHWSFVARKKARAPLMSFPLLPFSAPLFLLFIFFFINTSLSFQAGCDLWQQAAAEEEGTGKVYAGGGGGRGGGNGWVNKETK